MTRNYTITVFTDNQSGVLHRLTTVFTRRKVNIESLCVSETERVGVSRFTISVRVDEALVRKVVAQISRIIEVVRVEFHTDDELLFREIAFVKVQAVTAEERLEVEEAAKRYGAQVVMANDQCVVVEKTGTEAEITSLYHLLEPRIILEFVRSGRIAMSRDAISGLGAMPRQVVTSSVFAA